MGEDLTDRVLCLKMWLFTPLNCSCSQRHLLCKEEKPCSSCSNKMRNNAFREKKEERDRIVLPFQLNEFRVQMKSLVPIFHGLQICGVSIAWRLVGNANSWAPVQTNWTGSSEGGAQASAFHRVWGLHHPHAMGNSWPLYLCILNNG